MAEAVQNPTERKPGRPRIYRDQSQKIEATRRRKAKQRLNEDDAGFIRMEIRVPKDILGSLRITAGLSYTTPKVLAAWLAKGALGPYRRELERIEKEAGELWLKAAPLQPYAVYLTKPGSTFRVRDRVLRHEDWQSIQDQLHALSSKLTHWGWPPDQISRFFRRSAGRITAAESGSKG